MALSQVKCTKHVVLKGETISSIAKKYSVSQVSIYEMNPDVAGLLKQNAVLLIPSGKSNFANESRQVSVFDGSHEVQTKETLYGISVQYKTTVIELQNANPSLLAKGLQVGQKIRVPNITKVSKNSVSEKNKETVQPKSSTKKETATFHKVTSKETMYSIAKLYQITIQELYTLNPELVNQPLYLGQQVAIPLNSTLPLLNKESIVNQKPVENSTVQEVIPKITLINSVKTELEENAVNDLTSTEEFTLHQVEAKQTKYGIAKQYNLKVADLDKLNPSIANEALKVGQKIKVPLQKKIIVPVEVVAESAVLKTAVPLEVKEKELEVVDSGAVLPEVKIEPILPIVNVDPVIEKVILQEPVIAIVDSKIEIPLDVNKSVLSKPIALSTSSISHTVLAKETKYGIAKKYGISVRELEFQNPAISKQLLVGSQLSIVGKNESESIASVVETPEIPMKPTQFKTDYKNTTELAEQLIRTACENLGVRYRSGGTTKDGFDCSGLMRSTFDAYAISLPRSSIEQAHTGVVINSADAQKGDLIFFKTTRSSIGHVGLVVEVLDNEIKFIHSSTSSGVMISSTKESYYQKRFVQVNRVLH